MNFHLLPFGEPAWVRRRKLLKEKILSRPGPPFDYRDVLYLVPNDRSVKTLRALFIEALYEVRGVRGCIPPVFETLNRFIERRAFAASKRPVLDRLARELVIEEICQREAEGFPSVRPGPALSAMIAEALDRLYLYEVKDSAWEELAGDSLPLSLLRTVKRGYEGWLGKKGLADPSAAKAACRPAPGDFQFKTAILDGFHDADPAEERLMKTLSQLPDSHFIVQAPGLDAQGACGEENPYFGTDRLLSALGYAEKMGSREADDASLFIGALFTGRPVRETYADAQKGISRGIRVVGALNADEEIYFIAREIKRRALDKKLDLNRVLVFFPDSEPYLPALRQAFGDYGISYYLSLGRPLISTPPARALLNMLYLPLEDYSFRYIRKVIASPATCLGADGAAASFDSLARRENIPGGRRRWEEFIKKIKNEHRTLSATLRRILELIVPLETKAATAREWAETALSLMESAGMEEAARSIGPEAEFETASLINAVERLKARTFPAEGTLPLGGFVSALKRQLHEARIRPSQQAVSGVRVLGRNEVFSEQFDLVFAGGLADGALPAPPRPGLFFPDSASARLGMPVSREMVSRDARLFLGLLLSAPEVFLLYPESGKRGTASPSPYIAALEPLIRAGAVGKEERWQRPMSPQEAFGKEELIRSVSLAGELSGNAAALRALVPEYPWPEAGLPESGAAPRVERERFSVTELEEYIFCTYKYYQSRVLGNRPLEDPDDDMDTGTVGSVVHEILHKFVEARIKGKGTDDPLALLKSIGGERFGELPDTMANREELRWFVEKVAPAFIEAERSLGASAVAGTEEKFEAVVNDPGGGTFVLTGKIDRIEVDAEGNFIVADYKTGRYPRSEKEQFQLPLYAHLLRANPGRFSQGMKRPSGFLYYNLRSENGMRDLVYYDNGVLSGGPRRGVSEDEIDEMIQSCLERAIAAVRGIRAGRFKPEPRRASNCRSCDYSDACGRKPADAEEDGGEGETDES